MTWRPLYLFINALGLKLGLLSNQLLTYINPMVLFHGCHMAGYLASVSYVQLPPMGQLASVSTNNIGPASDEVEANSDSCDCPLTSTCILRRGGSLTHIRMNMHIHVHTQRAFRNQRVQLTKQSFTGKHP